ncbi:MAG: cupin domain-containing protein [Methylococcales bacterium]|nr:cupin domain-containing protein [Methylococcales bacterium]
MSKSTKKYWNVLAEEHTNEWEVVEGTEGKIKQLTVAIDKETGDYIRLTQFEAGADTNDFGSKFHDYPEEIYVISGRLYDEAFDMWLEAEHYCNKPLGEVHGPFRSEVGCLVLEISYRRQTRKTPNK